MNTRKLLVSVLMLISILFSACAPAATPAPTAVPPTEAPTVVAAQGPTPFSSKAYKLPMSVSFGPDWHVVDEYTDLVTIAQIQQLATCSLVSTKSIYLWTGIGRPRW